MSQNHTLTLNIDSNITSGVAALVLDIFLLAFIKFHVQLICSSANLYLIYDKRSAISPKKSIFSSLAGGPVGPGYLAHLFSIVLVFVTACVVVLGFSINGKTEDRYEQVRFRSLVGIGVRPANIVYEREFERRRRRSNDGSNTTTVFISKRLAAMSDSYTCQANTYSKSQIFAFAYENLTVNFEMVGQLHKLKDAECVTGPNFKTPIITREYPIQPQAAPLSCDIEGVTAQFPDSVTKTSTAEIRVSNCDLSLTELQCYRDNERIACATLAEATKREGTFVFLIPNIDVPDTNEHVEVNGGLSEEDRRKLAMNVAFLSRAGFSGGVSNLANVAISHISFDEVLERKTENPQQVSEIDLTIAVPLLAVVIGVAMLVGIVSLILWISVVYRKRRIGYNKFTTVSDILEFATQCKGRLRPVKKGDVFIGISQSYPEITVVEGNEKELCCNSSWDEDEIKCIPFD